MNRRRLLQGAAAAIPLLSGAAAWMQGRARAQGTAPGARTRVRSGDPGWPAAERWDRLRRQVGGRLVEARSPLDACADAPDRCAALFAALKNPYYLGDEVGLTQTLGWVDAWISTPSAYAVAAETTADVVAAVNFAREHNLRLVVKGGGHSYQGNSCAPDSLLIWTRAMQAVTLHDAFIGQGCAGETPQTAVSVGAGAMWGRLYHTVTTGAGRYVQGGGCLTVGVAGLIQGGGFGSFSKAYGMAAASLLEAEVVTADGRVLVANACSNPELFWGLKGGGANLGVMTRLTLGTHDLPATFGAVFLTVKASSDAAFRRLIAQAVAFYARALFNPHWGEQIRLTPDNTLAVQMTFQGLDQAAAEAIWRPFLEAIDAAPQDFQLQGPPLIQAAPARGFWDPAFLRQLPGLVLADDRPGAPEANVFWAGNQGEAGQVIHGYRSAWLPAALLDRERQPALADALFAASRHWPLSLHTNKGLAGAPAEAIAAARDTALHPAVLDAFALVIIGAEGPPAHPGIPGYEPDAAAARSDAEAVARSMQAILQLVPDAASYVSESDYFQERWQDAFWGPNYPRLLAVKMRYDPDGLFFVHHGAGSERWSADGFVRLE